MTRAKTRKLVEMGLRQTTLSPLLRSVAALALVVYVVAQALCFLHCNFGGGHGDPGVASCHSAESAQACHEESDSPPPVPTKTTTCSTLKNTLVASDGPISVIPHVSVLYFLAPHALALEAGAPKAEAIFSRQANHSDWVLTPEVSLGPAFRSLAPPSLVS